MYYPTKKEFIKLAKKGNLIPVYKEIIADMETPVSAFKKIESGLFLSPRKRRGRRKHGAIFIPRERPANDDKEQGGGHRGHRREGK